MTTSIRTLSIVWAAVFGILALGVASALVWSSTRMRVATEQVFRDTMGARLAGNLERSLVSYQRLTLVSRVVDDPSIEAARAQVSRDIRELEQRAPHYVGSAREHDALSAMARAIDVYRREHALVDAQHLDYSQTIERTRTPFEHAIAAAAGLRAINDQQVDRMLDEARGLDQVSNTVAIAAGVLLGLGLGWLVVGARRAVLRPLLELDAAVRSYRGGEARLSIEPSGARELRSLGSALGEMSTALAEQRERQIAFVAGVVHDVRNPLSGMKSALQVARQDPEPQLLAQVLPMLDRQVDRLSHMLGDLLDAARIESGQLELRVERFDLRRAAREVTRLYAGTSPKHELVLTTADEPVFIEGDPGRLEQVIGNLVSNAIKYSPEGGKVEIDVWSERRAAIIEVKDQGIGIPADGIGSVFLPFRRTATEVAPGAGLGLSVAHRIVRAHGGEVSVESTPGRGSTFRVRLPLSAKVARGAMQADATAP